MLSMMTPARPTPSSRILENLDMFRLPCLRARCEPGKEMKANKDPVRPVLGRTGYEMRSKQQSLFRLQLQRRRIDAVAQAGRAGAVVEDVAEMAVTFRAQHLGADHAVADIVFLVDMAIRRGRGKARPAAAGIEFRVGFEQRLAAAGAGVSALAVLMLVLAGEGTLGRLLAQHGILHRRQFLAPLGLALLDLACRLGVGHL